MVDHSSPLASTPRPRMPTRPRCARCQQFITIDTDSDEDLWAEVIGERFGPGYICDGCFTRAADERLIDWVDRVRFVPLSLAGHRADVTSLHDTQTTSALSLPCKSGECAIERELGSPCENCSKPVEVGQLVIYYDDVGEMHADCENPFSLDYDPPKDAAPEPVILLGSPMVHVPLALLAPDATQTREAEGQAWHCPELRDLFNDAERLRNHALGDSRWMELMRGVLDMLKAADTELACDDAIITAALNARGDA